MGLCVGRLRRLFFYESASPFFEKPHQSAPSFISRHPPAGSLFHGKVDGCPGKADFSGDFRLAHAAAYQLKKSRSEVGSDVV